MRQWEYRRDWISNHAVRKVRTSQAMWRNSGDGTGGFQQWHFRFEVVWFYSIRQKNSSRSLQVLLASSRQQYNRRREANNSGCPSGCPCVIYPLTPITRDTISIQIMDGFQWEKWEENWATPTQAQAELSIIEFISSEYHVKFSFETLPLVSCTPHTPHCNPSCNIYLELQHVFIVFYYCITHCILIVLFHCIIPHYSLGYWAIFSNPAVQLFSCKLVTIKLSWVELSNIICIAQSCYSVIGDKPFLWSKPKFDPP